MKSFVNKYLIYLFSVLAVLTTLELLAREHYKSLVYLRKKYLDEHKSEIEGIAFGPSHMERALYPKLLDYNTVSLAMSSSAPNTDYFLYKYSTNITNPKFLIFDLSLGYLFKRNNNQYFSKTQLSYYYSNDNKRELKDLFILRYPFRNQLEQIVQPELKVKTDEWGFVKKIDDSKELFKRCNYKDDLIVKHKHTRGIIRSHGKKILNTRNIDIFEENIKLYQEIIEESKAKGVKVIFVNTPKYHIYNNGIKENKEFQKKRNKFLKEVVDNKTCFYFDFSRKYEDNVYLFFNVNHMNVEGAKLFTKDLNKILNDIIQ